MNEEKGRKENGVFKKKGKQGRKDRRKKGEIKARMKA